MLRKLLAMMLLALGLAAAVVPMGCRAEAEIDPDERAAINVGN